MKRIITLIILIALFGCASSEKVISEYPYKDGLKVLSNDLHKNIVKNKNERFAILPFNNETGEKIELGYSIADDLQISMFQLGNIKIIERERVDSILEEHQFSRSGLVDADYIKQIGKMLSADSIITGTIRDFDKYFEVYGKVLDVETGELISASSVSIKKDELLVQKYQKKVFYNASIAGAYKLTIKNVHFATMMKDGFPLDASGDPDLVVSIRIAGNELYETEIYDAFPDVEINETAELILKEDSIIEFYFLDSDMFSYQFIDKYLIPPEVIRKVIGEDVNANIDSVIGNVAYRLEKIGTQ